MAICADVCEKCVQPTLDLRCRHHWRIDPSESVCRCEGEAHRHAVCKLCGATRIYPTWVPISEAAKRYARMKGEA